MKAFLIWCFGGVGAALIATLLGYWLLLQGPDMPEIEKQSNNNQPSISFGNNATVSGDVIGRDKIEINK